MLLFIVFMNPTQAAFVDAPGKRLTALGGAGTASAGDPMGFFYNPASHAWGTGAAFETQYGRMFWGLEGDRLSRGALGGYLSIGTWGSIGLGYDRFAGALYEEERTLLAYSSAFKLNDFHFAFGLGFNVLGRYYQETKYTAVDPFFRDYGYNKRTVAIDLGSQLRINPRLMLGLAVRNANRPNQALDKEVEDILPSETQLGLVYSFNKAALFADIEFRDRAVGSTDINPRIGVEVPILEQFMHLRGGVNRDEITTGFGLNVHSRQYERGYYRVSPAGQRERMKEVKFLKVRVGYTFRYPIGGVVSTAGHHQFGIDVYFDKQQSILESTILSKPDMEPKVIIETDTIRVKEPQYIHVEVEDTATVKALEEIISNLESDNKALLNINEAMRWLDTAQKEYLRKNYNAALNACDQALRLVPSIALGYKRKGSILFALGRYAEAKQNWQRCMELDPGDNEVKRFIDQLP
ncbi:MAG: tetratricopeptide repeat protein [Candidatus Electryonea clarkiae]|nr:tetratricopeptide repeat protein [Candidatus Electryonea clarkiae]MDP8286054.1 tetratricopeptide repeat protein [Candidatus Electryonea clarkiae]